jgi:hypothetical protein
MRGEGHRGGFSSAAFSTGKSKILSMFAILFDLRHPERGWIRPSAADLCSILSVENRAGALRTHPGAFCRVNRHVSSPLRVRIAAAVRISKSELVEYVSGVLANCVVSVANCWFWKN